MTFAYVGYVWALIGCSFLMIFVGSVALTLYLIGRRVDRGAPRTVVESLSRSAPSPTPASPDVAGDAVGPSSVPPSSVPPSSVPPSSVPPSSVPPGSDPA
ncbi:MAG: hypothetical protein M3Y87_24310, partial [Myxococcota bacterium]|nr:hypothetical protein [Myxococcota bacterium]